MLFVFGCTSFLSNAQMLNRRVEFSRADSLRGYLSDTRSSYDINYYHLSVQVDIGRKFISGSNLFRFTVLKDIKRLQFDLFDHLRIRRIVYRGIELPFSREYNAVFIDFPQTISKGSIDEFTVFYDGNPIIAKKAPWDGGFVFSKDQAGNPWVAVACQGFGASSWWPVKDHQSDEPDSMQISVSVPAGLMDVSNGRLRSVINQSDGYVQYNWAVTYPINSYNVSLNIADYASFQDNFDGANGKLTLDYYVLRENLEQAKAQFEADVKPTLSSFENWFGPYPFYRDGYKLVETPYLGMEHQSAVAYGNKYMKGYLGDDLSRTGLGLSWDYIIVHETAHEWWGNNVTSKDIADMWIHEGFGSYAEGLFVESREGKEAGATYIKGLRRNIRNNGPVIGPYDVNKEGSGDMYYKGANLLQAVRTIIDDDFKWRNILRGLNKELGLKTTTTEEVVNYINTKAGKDLTNVFDQYLRFKDIPELEVKTAGNLVSYRWKSDVQAFDMPLRIKFKDSGDWKFIRPSSEWKRLTLKPGQKFIPDTDNFYIKYTKLQS